MALAVPKCASAIPAELTLLNIPVFSFGAADFDLVLTFWNRHNFTEERRNNLNWAAFQALESGGVYKVADHTRRHMQPDNRGVARHLYPAIEIKKLTALGFEFGDYNPLRYHSKSDLAQKVGA